MIWPTIGLVLVAGILLTLYFVRARTASRARFIDSYRFPKGLDQKLMRRHPGLGAEQTALVYRGLRQYFRVCLDARNRLAAMPSQVVDDLWHEFILYTRNYQSFCNKAFGRFLHHTPAQAMGARSDPNAGIRRTWWLSCRQEGIDPRKPAKLPLIFAIDGLLNIENGFRYIPDCRQFAGAGSGSTPYCGSDLGHGSCSGGCGGSTGDGIGDGGGDGSGCSGGGCGGGD
jgi:hypothetical protein